jgi:hypothetical protein
VTWRKPSISLIWRVPPADGASLWTWTSIEPASTSASRGARDLEALELEVGRSGEGVCSGEDTSDSDSEAGVGERAAGATGSDFRVFLAGDGLVSRATLFLFVFRLLVGASGGGDGSADDISSADRVTVVA